MDVDISNIANWHEFGKATVDGSFMGGLDAVLSNLSDNYYLIRGEVTKDKIGNVANTETSDQFAGPSLGDAFVTPPGTTSAAPDKSGKLTVQWLSEKCVIVQIKIDAKAVKAATKFQP
jgi:hypothetical protein